MKSNRKLCAFFLSALTISSIASLSSCGNKASIPDFEMPEGGFDTTQEIEITFFHTMNKTLQDVLEAYIVEFNKLYPNITVNHQQIGGYDDVKDQMTTALSAGGNECDIAYCYPDHVALYNKNKALVTLDTLINDTQVDENNNLLYGMSTAQQSDFIPAYWNEGKAFGDDKMYMLPWSKSSEVMYYNKTYFDEKGLSVPTHWFSTGDADTSSVEYVCAAIKQDDPDSIPLGYDSDSNWFITMCEQLNSGYTTLEGKSHYVFDNETNRGFIEKFKSWYSNGYITTKTLYGQYTSGLFTAKIDANNKIRSYMSIGSSAGATNQLPEKINGEYPFEVAIAGIPQADLENPKVISQGPSICLFRNENPQKVLASWLFARFFTTNVAFQAQFSMSSGYTPVIKSVRENSVYSAFLNDKKNLVALSTTQCVEQADAYFVSPAFPGSSEARTQVGSLLSAAISGSKTVSQAFTDAMNVLNYRG